MKNNPFAGYLRPMRWVIRSLLLVTAIEHVGAQEKDALDGKVYFGVGAGLDHGGLGVRADVRPIPHLAVFGGAGSAFAGIGWNAGLIGRILPESKVTPYVIGMYGYNTAYVLKQRNTGTQVDSDLYYGPSFGGGVELKAKGRNTFWHLGLLVPLRPDQAKIDHPSISDDLWPVLVSVGYHFEM